MSEIDWEGMNICPNCGEEKGNFSAVHWCSDCRELQRKKTKTIQIEVSKKLFYEYADKVSCGSLTDDKAKGIIERGQKLYVATGSMKGDNGKVWASEILPRDQHEGPMLSYNQLSRKNGTGGMHHSNNHLFSYRGTEYVIQPYLVIEFVIGAAQESMF